MQLHLHSCRTHAWILRPHRMLPRRGRRRGGRSQAKDSHVIALAEAGGSTMAFVARAKIWLNQLATKDNFTVDYIENTDKIDDAFLSHYQVFIQLNYPPYNWTPTAKAAFAKYIEQGKGGWMGFHHATLLGEFDGFQMWPWFSRFHGWHPLHRLHSQLCRRHGHCGGPNSSRDAGRCQGNFWSSRKNGTRGTNRRVPMCMYSPAWMRVRTHPTPRRRWEIIPSCGRTNTTRQETFTSLWGIIRSCSTIRHSRRCFRIPSSGPRINERSDNGD